MKKLLALAALAALTLTGCGGTGGKSDAPPALFQPADYEHDTAPPVKREAPGATYRKVAEVPGNNTVFEINGTNSNGVKFRCYLTDGNTSVAQTCFEYPAG